MGLMDRDYMHDRHNRTARSPVRKFKGPSRKFPEVKVVMAWGLAFAAVFFAVKWALDSADAQTFPATGNTLWFVPLPNPGQGLAPLTITSPNSGDALHAIVMREAGTKKLVGIVPMRTAETTTVQIPLGQYEFIFASGYRWYGPEKLFGSFGHKNVAVKTFDFYRSNNGIQGYQIDLNGRLNGNLQTRPTYFDQ